MRWNEPLFSGNYLWIFYHSNKKRDYDTMYCTCTCFQVGWNSKVKGLQFSMKYSYLFYNLLKLWIAYMCSWCYSFLISKFNKTNMGSPSTFNCIHEFEYIYYILHVKSSTIPCAKSLVPRVVQLFSRLAESFTL